MPGRPRDANIETRTISATQELLQTHTPDNITIDLIAKQAGIAKSTIYRRYHSKDDIVVAALVAVKSMDLSDLPLTDLNETATIIADRFIAQYNNKTARVMLSTLFQTLNGNEKIAATYFQEHGIPQTDALAAVLSHFELKIEAAQLADLLIHYAIGVFLMESIENTPTTLKQGLHQLLAAYQ